MLSYGNDTTDNYRRAATYVDRILKGAKPSLSFPSRPRSSSNCSINLKAVKALGLTVSPSLPARADKVIE